MALYVYNSKNLDVEHQHIESSGSKNFRLHSHAYFEICYFIKGSAVYHIEGNQYPLLPGDIVLLRPNEAHYIQIMPGEPTERILLSFGNNLYTYLDPTERLAPPFINRDPGTRNLYRPSDFPELALTEHFERLITDDNRSHVLICLLQLLEDLNKAFCHMFSYEQRTETMETKLIRLINDNFHLNLTLQELADRFYISRAQLCRRFQKATGTSLGRYLNDKRLTAAQQLLNQGRTASDVCAMCGFRDYSSFYRAYTRHFGHSPTANFQK